MAWILLSTGVLISIAANTLLKESNGFSNIWLGIGALLLFAIGTYFYSIAIKTIPLAVAYAVWSGIGILVITFVGVIWFKESIGYMGVFFITMILIGCIGLNIITKAS